MTQRPLPRPAAPRAQLLLWLSALLLLGALEGAGAKKIVCQGGKCFSSRVKVALMGPEHGLTYCTLCRDPRRQGSHVDVWESHFRPPRYAVVGELVYAVPNDGSSELLNVGALRGNVALLDRGGSVPIVYKVRRAQAAGAKAVVIVDDGDCDASFDCRIMGKRAAGRGFSARDREELWSSVKIPAVVALQSHGAGLKAMMNLEVMHLQGLGAQQMEEE